MKHSERPIAFAPKSKRSVINFACVNDDYQTPTDRLPSFMSIRLYIGNLGVVNVGMIPHKMLIS